MDIIMYKSRSTSILTTLVVATFWLLGATPSLWGQRQSQVRPNTIFEALSSHSEGEGKVFIRQPRELRSLTGKVDKQSQLDTDSHKTIQLISGYRIQLYNGNLPNSKQEAYTRATEVNKIFPEVTCYISFRAPFWRVVAGDYATIDDARAALQALKEAMPSMAEELYIVQDKIRKH